jgi:hypothetical protein
MEGRGQEEERGQIKSFETHDLKELKKVAEAAEKESKILFIADMSGKCKTYFEYNEGVFELHAWCKRCSI